MFFYLLNAKLWGQHQPHPVVVVPVVGTVVVAISHTAVLRVVVPAAAAKHAVGGPFGHTLFLLYGQASLVEKMEAFSPKEVGMGLLSKCK